MASEVTVLSGDQASPPSREYAVTACPLPSQPTATQRWALAQATRSRKPSEEKSIPMVCSLLQFLPPLVEWVKIGWLRLSQPTATHMLVPTQSTLWM